MCAFWEFSAETDRKRGEQLREKIGCNNGYSRHAASHSPPRPILRNGPKEK